MKKLVTTLGAVLACLLLAGLAGFWALVHFGDRLDAEAKAYVDDAIPKIVGAWQPRELLDRASPELLAAAPAETVETVFSVFSTRLGPLRRYQGSSGRATMGFGLGQGGSTTAAFDAVVIFENAPATINVRAIRRDGQWRILQLVVNSDALVAG